MAKIEASTLCQLGLFPPPQSKASSFCSTNCDDSSSQYISDEETGKIRSSIFTDSESEERVDPNLVTWDGPNDPHNPKNWPLRRKWAITVLVSAFAFISPLSSSMAAPALDSIGNDLHIPTGIQLQLVLSIFLIAYSFGPFVLSPCSEIWGRVRIIQFGNMVFILFNTLCGFARTKEELTAFRFLAGFGGSATLGMGSAVLSDCWSVDERGRGMSIYQLAPVLGPALGPIAGGFITQNTTWRWTFWSLTCFNVLIQIFAMFIFEESYAPRILFLKARKLRQEIGNSNFHTQWEKAGRTLPAILQISLTRPWTLLATQPIIQVLAIYQAYNFGLLYLLISSFPSLWEGRYGMTKGMASLNYISLATGALLGAQICGPVTDAIYRRLKISHNSPGIPEFRIPLMIPASIIAPCGIFLYGWAAEAKVHWILPNIGAALFTFGSMISYLCIQTYLVDTYTQYAASASAAASFLRSLAAFSFPLFAPYLFQGLGYGWGSTTLGLISVVLGIPAPFAFWLYGQKLRLRSPFATDV